MAKAVTEKERAFWRNEIHEWKCAQTSISFDRWCVARDLNAADMPRPLNVLDTLPAKQEPTAYDLKQERRRKRARNAIRRAERKEKRKQKEKK